MTDPKRTLTPEEEKVYRKIAGMIAFARKLKSKPGREGAMRAAELLLIKTGDWEVEGGLPVRLVLDENGAPVPKKKGGSDDL